MQELISKHLDIWTKAQVPKAKGGRGRGRKANGELSPYGIKKLQKLILELAVRGKLVEQDSSDEPASVLLEKIAKEKAQLVKEGKNKKQKKLPEIMKEEKPFKLPVGWEWVRLGTSLRKITDGTHHSPPNGEQGDYLYISAKNIKPEGVLLSNATYVNKKVHEKIYSRCDPEYGDILYIKDGATTGIVTINSIEEPFSMLSSVALLKVPEGILNTFLLQLLTSPYFYETMRAGMTGVAITRVTLKKLNFALIALPPLAEQHRIVAKVIELMAICDQLEQRQTNSNTTHQALLETLLTTLTSATDHKEFATTWQRIADHFHILFTTEESIDQLKQTILQLAVMGKLVPQNPDDEPASVLLKKIKSEKKRLIKEGKIKKEPWAGKLPDVKKYFTEPTGWSWANISNAVEKVTVGFVGSMKSHYVDSGVPFLRTQNVRENRYRPEGLLYISEEFHNSISKSKLNPGDVVVTRSGNIGVSCVIPPSLPDANCSDLVIVKRPMGLVPEYLCFFLNSFARKQIEEGKVGMALTHFNTKSVAQLAIPLPPLAEQHRIVAMVDELMTLCDTIKARLSESQTTQIHLANAIVKQAVHQKAEER